MQEFWKQLSPVIISTLAGLITAAGLFAKAWLAARTEAQKQAVLGAAHAVDVTDMDGADKKAAAIKMAAARLPAALARNEKKLGAMVESVMPQVQAARVSIEPSGVGPVPEDRATKPDRPRAKS